MALTLRNSLNIEVQACRSAWSPAPMASTTLMAETVPDLGEWTARHVVEKVLAIVSKSTRGSLVDRKRE